MGKKSSKTKAAPEKVAPPPRKTRWWLWPALIAVCVLVFYWVPMTSPSASIQWDAADLHYPLQKYFSDRVRSGELPFWTPHLLSGYPFLAYPEVGAWYVPNWPFFVAGITPRSIQFELVLHAFLACLGTWLFLSRLTSNRPAAMFGALAYGLSGFFAGHSSHTGIFSAAAGLPWLLLAFRWAMDFARPLRYAAVGGVIGGLMILAGHFQTSMYSYLALGLYALSEIYHSPRRWLRATLVVAGMLVLGVAIAAIEVLPALELTQQSIRAGNDFSNSKEGALPAKAFLTLVAPNSLGAISGGYTGPQDITQYYFYAGLLVLPLALAGLRNSRVRVGALALIVPSVWYMLGPAAGLYRLSAFVPGLYKVRAPVHGWFVAAFGLAVLAGAGFDWVGQRWRIPYFAPLAILILFADVWYWNSWVNPLAYARASFDNLYGSGEDFVRRSIVPGQAPLSRLDAPRGLTALGPLDHPLDAGLEATYGYLALDLAAYDDYTGAMRRNARLRDGLNVGRILSVERQRVEPNPSVLPRAYFPKTVADVGTAEGSRRVLDTLDPALGSVVLAPHATIQQDGAADASVTSYDEQSYRIRYRAASPSLLRLSVPWFPGWRAASAGQSYPVVRVDHALMGVIVPAGEREVEVRFHSTYLGAGLAITSLGLLFALSAATWPAWARRRATAV